MQLQKKSIRNLRDNAEIQVNRASNPEASAMQRVRWHVMPLLFAAYFAAYIDRVNVGFAALTMNRALSLSAEQFGIAAGLFFVSYVIFEVPSNLILARVGARVWIPRIMISWGLVSMLNAWVTGAMSFYTIRFLLGVGEAGLYPGLLYIITLWFPARYRVRMLSLLIASGPFSIAIGSLISEPILMLDGVLGLAGWQWLFVIQALPTIGLGLVIFLFLPNTPAEASWLSEEEKLWLTDQLSAEREQREQIRRFSVREALVSPIVWLLILSGIGIDPAAYGLVFFLPQMIHSLGISVAMAPYVNALPYLLTIVCMLYWGRHSDRHLERNWHAAIPAFISGIALISCGFLKDPLAIFIALSLGTAGVFCFVSVFWGVPAAMLGGNAAAAGLGLINAVSNVSSFLGPYLVGWAKTFTGSYSFGLVLIGLGPFVSAGVALSVRSLRRFERPSAD